MATDHEQGMPAWGVVALLSVLLTGGTGIFLSDTGLESAYYCPQTGEVGVFSRLSGTGKTAYYLVDDEEVSVACRSGRTYEAWVPILEYCAEQDLNCDLFRAQPETSTTSTTNPDRAVQWECSVSGCTRKEARL